MHFKCCLNFEVLYRLSKFAYLMNFKGITPRSICAGKVATMAKEDQMTQFSGF